MRTRKRVKALRDRQDLDPIWERGTIIGRWRESHVPNGIESGYKIQFDDGEIQEIPRQLANL